EELRRRQKLEMARTIGVMRGVCAAVEAAHRSQLIHRDLKPENIFLARSEDGTEVVKVLDFGIAKSLAVSTHDAETQVAAISNAGIPIGTPAYMSPEQFFGGIPSVQWDVWALAVITYELLSGTLPFAPGSTELVSTPPAGASRFFARTFADRVADRPSSAAEFITHLISDTRP